MSSSASLTAKSAGLGRRSLPTAALAVGAAHFLVALINIELTGWSTGLATIWAANAIVLAALIVVPPSRWWPYVAAAWFGGFLANWMSGYPLLASVPFAAFNVGEAALAAVLVRRTVDGPLRLERPGHLIRFIIAATLAALLSASFSAPFMDFATGQGIGRSFLSWFASALLGLLIVAPVILISHAIWVGRRSFLEGRSGIEAFALFGLVAAMSIAVFAQSRLPLLFLLLPPVVLTTFRLRSAGATVAIVIIGIVGSWFTTLGTGPVALVEGDLAARIYYFQFFLAATFLSALPVSSVLDERDALARVAERQAATDDLTGTASRRAFMQRLALEVPGGDRPLSVVLFDVDHFKTVNDRFGHDVGDEVLRRIGVEALACVGQRGIVGRLGGEEFAVIMPGVAIAEAVQICERLRQRCCDPALFPGRAVPVTISVGIALAVPGRPPTDALKAADGAMYRAKTGGRDRIEIADIST